MDKDKKLWNAVLKEDQIREILSGKDDVAIADAVRQLNGRPIRLDGQDIAEGYGTLEYKYLENGRFFVSLRSEKLCDPDRPLRALIVQDPKNSADFSIRNVDYWIPGVDFSQDKYDGDLALLGTMIRLHFAIEAETSLLREKKYSPDLGGTNTAHPENAHKEYNSRKRGDTPVVRRDPGYVPRGHRSKCTYRIYVRGTLCKSRKTGKTWYRKPHLRAEVPTPVDYGAPDWYFEDPEQDNEIA